MFGAISALCDFASSIGTETVDPRLLGLDPRTFSLGRAYLADPPPHGAINTGAAY